MFFIIILKKVATEISAGGPPSRILGVSKSDENLLFWLFQKLAAKHDPGIGDLGGSNVADIFGGPQYRSIFVDLLPEEISGTWGPSYDPTKIFGNDVFAKQKTTNGNFFDSEC